MACLDSCSGAPAFPEPSAGMIWLMSHMNGWILSVSLLWQLCQQSVTDICTVVNSVDEQLVIGEALRDWCGELLPGGSTGVNLYLGSLCY